ncbi:MAG: DUF6067 family protein [Bacteroidota bacterium]|nr:DUF6067 family protein [Bacteroidota bacterium]MDP4245105.1 DUF6067 family protein [Bacteroidota bacterium]MDP4254425.1 DUF6067 family protein [Bacteroidota bacterium]MDP4257839.1 DUF6067 family protein [Bacteroidota bacterium]
MQRSHSPAHSSPAFSLSSALFWLLSATMLLAGLRLSAQERPLAAADTLANIQVHGDTLDLPGLSVQLTAQGFPRQLRVIGKPAAVSPTDTTDLLAENIHFHFTRIADDKDIRLTQKGLHSWMRRPDRVRWQASAGSEELQMDVYGSMNSVGLLFYSVSVMALQDLELKDLTFHIPFNKEASGLMTGLGISGARPDSILLWPWSAARGHIANAWIGMRHAGLHINLSSTHGDHGQGNISVGIKGKSMLFNDYTGTCSLKKGTVLYYNFYLLITHNPPDSSTFIE